jgi:DNA-binding CsgD family transcriptional regulator
VRNVLPNEDMAGIWPSDSYVRICVQNESDTSSQIGQRPARVPMGYYGREHSHTFKRIGGVTLLQIGSLAPLERFFAFLTTFPEPDAACAALMRGPLSPLAAQTGSIWAQYETSELQLLGSYQSSSLIVQRYSAIPMNVDVPVVRCVATGELGIDEMGKVTKKFPALAIDSAIWEGLSAASGSGYLISVPLFASGISVGALGFVSSQSREFIEDYLPIISSISSALALWMTHPRLHTYVSTTGFSGVSSDSLSLTPRQLQILLLVEEGKSNAAIAHALGYSLSTVKQELQRTLHTLRVDGRRGAVARARELGLLTESE